MEQSRTSVPELSKRVRELIDEKFPPELRKRVADALREFHKPSAPAEDNRIHLDILEMCEGKIEKVERFVYLAKLDWRDLILMAEYERQRGKTVLNERGRRRFAEIEAARKLSETDSGE